MTKLAPLLAQGSSVHRSNCRNEGRVYVYKLFINYGFSVSRPESTEKALPRDAKETGPEGQRALTLADIGEVTSFNSAGKKSEDGSKTLQDGSIGMPEFDTGALFRDSSAVFAASSPELTAEETEAGEDSGRDNRQSARKTDGKDSGPAPGTNDRAEGWSYRKSESGEGPGGGNTSEGASEGASDGPREGAREGSSEALSPGDRNRNASVEYLDRGVEPASHILKEGETLADLAARYGKPSAEQMEAFKKAVATINGVDSENIEPGTELRLPGTDESGNFIHEQSGTTMRWWSNGSQVDTPDGDRILSLNDGTTTMSGEGKPTITTWADGRQRVQQTDGTTIDRAADGSQVETGIDGRVTRTDSEGRIDSVESPIATLNGSFKKIQQDDGSFVDTSTGARPGFDYTLTFSGKEGDMVLKEGDKELRFSDDPALAESRKALLDAARARIDNPQELSKFTADMIRFENRARQANLSQEEIKKTYEATGRLLEDNPDAKVDAAQRTKLAEQVMAQAAIPTGIDQGHHNTCNVTTVESILYTTKPSRAANLVADIATTGGFLASDGTRVNVPADSIAPDTESGLNPPPDGKRSYASQLLQLAAVNSIYQSRGDQTSYHQSTNPDPSRPGDTGERLFDDRDTPPRLKGDAPGLSSEDIAQAYKLITGEDFSGRILDNSFNSIKGGNFATPDQLHDRLTELSKDGRLPAILTVNAFTEPFGSDSGRSTAAGDSGGSHVVTVTGYDAEKRQLMIDNQWGSDKDHIATPVPLEQAFYATMNPETGNLYRARQDVERNHPDLTKIQTDFKVLAEHMKTYPDGGSALLGIYDSVGSADKAWQQQRRDGTFDQTEHDRTSGFMNEAFDQMPPVRNLQMLGIRMLENGGSYPEGQTAYQGEQAFYDRQFLTVADKAGLTGKAVRGEMTRIATDPSARFQEGQEVLFEAAKLMRNLNPEEQDALLRRLSSN